MKFVRDVEHRTFSGRYAWKRGQPVLYITERAVFRLCAEGIELIEIAPGVDLERDVLAQMEFRPVMNEPPKLMDAAIFRDGKMGLRDRMLAIPLSRRFAFARGAGHLLHQLRAARDPPSAGHRRRSRGGREEPGADRPQGLRDRQLRRLHDRAGAGRRMVGHGAVPDGSAIYTRVTRYTTSNFLRMKLGDALEERGVAPHIYESAQEALAHLDRPKA